MFIKHLCGYDEVTWKYVYIIEEYVNSFERFDLDAYRKAVRLIYPYRYVITQIIFLYDPCFIIYSISFHTYFFI